MTTTTSTAATNNVMSNHGAMNCPYFHQHQHQPRRKHQNQHQAKNISGMDVAPSRVVVCSADYAWYYEVPEQNSSITTSQRRNRHQDQQGTQQEHIQWVQLSAERCPRGYDGGSSQGSSGEDKNDAGEEATTAAKAPPPGSVRGFRLPSPFVTEARFSGDGERCFFGTISGQIYVVSFAIGQVESHRKSSSRMMHGGFDDAATCLCFTLASFLRCFGWEGEGVDVIILEEMESILSAVILSHAPKTDLQGS